MGCSMNSRYKLRNSVIEIDLLSFGLGIYKPNIIPSYMYRQVICQMYMNIFCMEKNQNMFARTNQIMSIFLHKLGRCFESMATNLKDL